MNSSQNCGRSSHRSSPPEVFLEKSVLKVCRKCMTTLLKSHFGMSVLLYICCIFSEQLFLGTPLGGCFYKYVLIIRFKKISKQQRETFKEILRSKHFWASNKIFVKTKILRSKYIYCFSPFQHHFRIVPI